MNKSIEYTTLRVGNYVLYNQRLCQILDIDKVIGKISLKNKQNPAFDLNLNQIQQGHGIYLTDKYLTSFGFGSSKIGDLEVFIKDSLILAKYYPNKDLYPHVYNPIIEKHKIDFGYYPEFVFYSDDIHKNTSCLFRVHCLQNYLNDNPNLTKIDFDEILPTLFK
jgi:hypothetical protein